MQPLRHRYLCSKWRDSAGSKNKWTGLTHRKIYDIIAITAMKCNNYVTYCNGNYVIEHTNAIG